MKVYHEDENVYICNECDEIHEDETDTCDLCGEETRVVNASEIQYEKTYN